MRILKVVCKCRGHGRSSFVSLGIMKFMCDQLKLVYGDPHADILPRGYGRDGIHLNSLGDEQLTNFMITDLGLHSTGI